ncbi:MAG: YceI family protein [bacterium]|nr:YceI family protein [bacterium]
MKNKIFITLLFVSSILSSKAQQYITKTGIVKFFSHTTLEDIKAENRKVVSVLDSKTGIMEFTMLMKGFDFPNDLMEQHFNESYAESSLFPKAGFKGTITDISKVNFAKDGTYNVNYTGKMTIKNVTKDITGTASIVVKGNNATATTKIKVKPSDYNFKIPATAVGKISDEMDVDIIMDYKKK